MRADTLLVSIDDEPVSDWSINDGGTLSLASAPPAGSHVRAGFLFDVPVRFAEDRIEVSAINFAAGEAPSIPLIGLRETSR
ncbi:MAG: DUF2460 domain-containing protein [Pseudomonadota bacterium]|nr:DUF2460 domain-containing protein [Pseudomonadota bacterium]